MISVCQILVGRVLKIEKNRAVVDINGKKTIFSCDISIKQGDFALISKNTVSRKIEVANA